MASDLADIAHVLRRLTFGPHPGQVETLASMGSAGVIEELLRPTEAGPFGDPVTEVPAHLGEDGWDSLVLWWIEQMQRPEAGLHERMVWYWHTHFTSSVDKAPAPALVAQQVALREHALGNFRELTRAMLRDPGLLLYLDASGSLGANPNENLARELMELFTMGRGTYTEADVRSAAKTLSGRWVDWETGEVAYDRDSAYLGVVEILGRRGRFSAEDLADIVCDHDACATHVARRLYTNLVGQSPPDDELARVAGAFRDADLDIVTLVEAIVGSDAFTTSANVRTRTPLEWYLAATRAMHADVAVDPTLWQLDGMGQLPYRPPNVSGWPEGHVWVSASQMLARANALFAIEPTDRFAFDETDPVPDVLAHCGLYDVSDATRATLDEAYWAPLDAADVNRLLVHLACSSPEFSLS